MAIRLEGTPVAASLMEETKQEVAKLQEKKVQPCLAIVQVGKRQEDLAYKRGAIKRAEYAGVQVRQFDLPQEVSEETVMQTLREINSDPKIHGCLLFCPLPPHLDRRKIMNALAPEKDIDAITAASMGGVLLHESVGFAPCTAAACLKIMHYYGIPIKGRNVTMVGKSSTVGLPTALLMMNEEATVSVCHIFTDPEDVKRLCQQADIIISAAGCANLIGRDHVRKGQVVIDVGINVDAQGKLCGDVDFPSVEPIVEAITPVPGGVGAVTSTIMISHVVKAAQLATA